MVLQVFHSGCVCEKTQFALQAGIQSGPGSKTATWVCSLSSAWALFQVTGGLEMFVDGRTSTDDFEVIWPFLADSIAMAVVESAMEEVGNAMDDYADQAALEHM